SEVLNQLKTPTANIYVYAPSNTLIITETGTNMRRLLEMVSRLDRPGGETRFVYQVEYASASELATTLLSIFEEQDNQPRQEDDRRRRRRRRDEEDDGGGSDDAVGDDTSVSVSQIIADERTNQLIIVASPRSYEAIREMAELLDQPIEGEGEIHVLFLENANATELAGTLQSLTQSIQDQREDEGRRRRTDDSEQAQPDSQAAGLTFTGDVNISADEATNALVVVASLRDFLNLERVVAQLDRRREQVYVEAVIMEITSDTNGQYGIAFNSGALPNLDGEDFPIFGGTQLGGLNSIVLDPTSLMGLAVGVRGPEIDGTEGLFGPGIGLPSFGAILQAVQTDTSVNVLSTPHILTTDNEEAEIVVGENVPFVTGGFGNVSSLLSGLGNISDSGDSGDLNIGSLAGLSGGLGLPSFQVQRESVSLTLRIRPQINESNFVRLEIEEEVEDIVALSETLGPTTSTRQARTVVVVEDQQTVVIGGLIQDSVSETVSKVPVLGDIPVLGYLFRRTEQRTVKRNLLLLLTPYIIRDSSDFHAIFRRKMDERQEFLEFFGRDELDYVADIDYARKDGPFQSIFETINDAVENEEQRRRAQGMHDAPQLSPTLQASPISDDE
ncbi:MAG: type II secretion system secretin GspD, partial [Myxococcales bacterium]|nr:type II secretion system secretin GspD [Myxococcales bacterium]